MNRIVPVDDNCKDKGKHNSIDIIKASVCFLIVGSHCLPLFSNDVANYYYGQWFFRFCVPFFFIVTGLFFSRMDRNRKLQYIKRILLIYLASTALYFPMFFRSDLPQIIWYCIFGYRHLWYLSALAIGLICTYLLEKAFGDKKIVFVAALMGGGTA